MSETFSIRLTGTEQTAARLERMRGGLAEAARRAMSDSLAAVYRRTQANLTGKVLNVQTGRLRQSIQTSVSGDGSRGIIGTNVEYAAIHEYGGKTRPHAIFPRNLAGALQFRKTGVGASQLRYTRGGRIARDSFNAPLLQYVHHVNHPGSVIPARPYLRPALAESLDDIRAAFHTRLRAVVEAGA